MWSVECGVRKCKVWSAESVECSVKCGVWSAEVKNVVYRV